MKRVIFRPAPELNVMFSQVASAAAPFDTPNYISLMIQGNRLVAEFTYALGSDEPTVEERLKGGAVAHVGQVSKRVMRLEIPRDYEKMLENTAEEYREREQSLSTSAQRGAPLRMAAHYGFVSSAMIQEMLPRLRSVTER